MYCSICGKKTDEPYLAEIEGANIEVCNDCSKFGKVIKKVEKPPEPRKKREKEDFEIVYEIVPSYASTIKRIRRKSGLKTEDFAKKINEKESVLKNIESGNMEPSLKLAQKLERMFGIKLVETREVRATKGKHQEYEDEGVTLGDVIKLK